MRNDGNKVFEELASEMEAYEKLRAAFNATREANRESMSKDEYWEWINSVDVPEYPLTRGQAKALSAWYWGTTEELNIDDFLCEEEVHDFIATLREAGLKSFTCTNSGSSLMSNIHAFAAEGCKIAGLCEAANRKGIRFEL